MIWYFPLIYCRYLAICFTLEHKMTWKIGKIIVILIWVLSFSIMIPWLIYFEQRTHFQNHQMFYICVQEWPDENGEPIFYLVILIICYILPLFLITLCYSLIGMRVSTRKAPGIFRYSNVIQKSKVKVIKMLALIVFLFGISWLPLYTIFMILYFDPPDYDTTLAEFLINTCVPIAQWLAYSNSGINPIIYCFFSKAIRKRIVAMIACSRTEGIQRRQSRLFSSTRLMSVDYYSNGNIVLRLNKRRAEANCMRPCNGEGNGNVPRESTFYD